MKADNASTNAEKEHDLQKLRTMLSEARLSGKHDDALDQIANSFKQQLRMRDGTVKDEEVHQYLTKLMYNLTVKGSLDQNGSAGGGVPPDVTGSPVSDGSDSSNQENLPSTSSTPGSKASTGARSSARKTPSRLTQKQTRPWSGSLNRTKESPARSFSQTKSPSGRQPQRAKSPLRRGGELFRRGSSNEMKEDSEDGTTGVPDPADAAANESAFHTDSGFTNRSATNFSRGRTVNTSMPDRSSVRTNTATAFNVSFNNGSDDGVGSATNAFGGIEIKTPRDATIGTTLPQSNGTVWTPSPRQFSTPKDTQQEKQTQPPASALKTAEHKMRRKTATPSVSATGGSGPTAATTDPTEAPAATLNYPTTAQSGSSMPTNTTSFDPAAFQTSFNADTGGGFNLGLGSKPGGKAKGPRQRRDRKKVAATRAAARQQANQTQTAPGVGVGIGIGLSSSGSFGMSSTGTQPTTPTSFFPQGGGPSATTGIGGPRIDPQGFTFPTNFPAGDGQTGTTTTTFDAGFHPGANTTAAANNMGTTPRATKPNPSSPFFSPMSVASMAGPTPSPADHPPQQQSQSQPQQQNDFTFNIGASGNDTKSQAKKTPGRAGVSAAARRRRHRAETKVRRNLNNHDQQQPPSSPAVGARTGAGTGIPADPSGAIPYSFSGGNQDNTESVDYTGRNARVSSLRDDARESYRRGDYGASVSIYSTAITTHGDNTQQSEYDDVRAVLLANRAAALLMIGAHEAAAVDCMMATTCVSDTTHGAQPLSSEGGPVLKAKLFTRMARALLKLGNLDEAAAAFQNAVATAERALEIHQAHLGPTDSNIKYLTQSLTDATMGTTDVSRCRENIDMVKHLGLSRIVDVGAASRRDCLRALSGVNMALSMASGSRDLHDMKIALLAALRRWRELLLHAERVAADTVKYDGVFVGDLADRSPNPGIPPAMVLSPTLFESCQTPAELAAVKLSSRAVGEAVARMTSDTVAFYIRGLRLEERYHNAHTAISELEKAVQHWSQTDVDVQTRYSWLSGEKDRLERTTSLKDKGDSLFREANYDGAAQKYSDCMTIDAEGPHMSNADSGENAGGRLHAVLFCNRAAAYMAIVKYREAINDCSAALNIHNRYMKALLRRSRCYVRMNRLDEGIAEYERYIQLVLEARRNTKDGDAAKSSIVVDTPCVFDGPKEVSDKDLESVRGELDEVKKNKAAAERNARAEETQRQNRNKWYSQTFGDSATGSSHSSSAQDDAYGRREHWYSEQSSSSRRWDSFNGRGPNRTGSYRQQYQNETQRQSSRRQNNGSGTGGGASSSNAGRSWESADYGSGRANSNRTNSNGYGYGGSNAGGRSGSNGRSSASANVNSSAAGDHYSVLGVARTATDAQIKKAYHKMALKYHPDKNKEAGADEIFRNVKTAYDVLSDTDKRREYDSQLRWSRYY